jgi:hypothetical protein
MWKALTCSYLQDCRWLPSEPSLFSKFKKFMSMYLLIVDSEFLIGFGFA